MIESQIFHTDRLILRPVKIEDFKQVLSWENDSENWLQSGVVNPYSDEEIRQYVAKPEDLFKDGQTRYIIDLSENEAIGCVDLFDFENELSMASVGVLIDDKYRRKGYGSEALEGLAFIAKSQYKLTVLKALILAENNLSVQLFKKNGYLADDTKASVYTYSGRDYLQLAFFKEI